MKIPQALKSRKFLLVVAYTLYAAIAEVVGVNIPDTILFAVLGWIGVEGAVDVVRWMRAK